MSVMASQITGDFTVMTLRWWPHKVIVTLCELPHPMCIISLPSLFIWSNSPYLPALAIRISQPCLCLANKSHLTVAQGTRLHWNRQKNVWIYSPGNYEANLGVDTVRLLYGLTSCMIVFGSCMGWRHAWYCLARVWADVLDDTVWPVWADVLNDTVWLLYELTSCMILFGTCMSWRHSWYCLAPVWTDVLHDTVCNLYELTSCIIRLGSCMSWRSAWHCLAPVWADALHDTVWLLY